MFEHLAGWLSPDRMKNGLTIDTGPRHRTEDSHGAVYRSRRCAVTAREVKME